MYIYIHIYIYIWISIHTYMYVCIYIYAYSVATQTSRSKCVHFQCVMTRSCAFIHVTWLFDIRACELYFYPLDSCIRIYLRDVALLITKNEAMSYAYVYKSDVCIHFLIQYVSVNSHFQEVHLTACCRVLKLRLLQHVLQVCCSVLRVCCSARKQDSKESCVCVCALQHTQDSLEFCFHWKETF